MDQDWICTSKWVQATPNEGAWSWTLWLVDEAKEQDNQKDEPKFTKLAQGGAMTKLGVYWQVWRACRKHGLRFRPNVRGKLD